jgi:misacylated tRNA(Ala) deacylase
MRRWQRAALKRDFHRTDPLDKAPIEAGLDRLVEEAHPVSQRCITDAELGADPGLVRAVRD